ncbi:MAG: class I SAM-dependent methyltransferase [Pirellula sp.]|jgi:ubiquinone/menaquinone biosynthesis C-methylase UbiE
MIEKIYALVRKIKTQFAVKKKMAQLQQSLSQSDEEYQAYVGKQLSRTINKKVHRGTHTYFLIDEINAKFGVSGKTVLCVGCRNLVEVEYFESKSASKITAIDLNGDEIKILSMDMHNLKFPDKSFDIVFSSHSLEHSFDPKKVISELSRVAIPGGIIAVEVPVGFVPSEVDRVDFGTIERLSDEFSCNNCELIWSERQGKESERNPHRMEIIRCIFQKAAE